MSPHRERDRPLRHRFGSGSGSRKRRGHSGADRHAAQRQPGKSRGTRRQRDREPSGPVRVRGEDLSEGDEQFGLRLTSTEDHANYFISFRPGRVPQLMTITDDEPLPTLGITPSVEVAEPSTGQASAVFTVSLTGPISQRPVTVEFNTSQGTAAAGTTCPRSTENVDYLTGRGRSRFRRRATCCRALSYREHSASRSRSAATATASKDKRPSSSTSRAP